MSIRNHIPNAITSMNLLCGVLGVIAAFDARLDLAFYLMIAGAVFDFCDGLSARALKSYSPMGKELDSLADVVTFGVLPSVMLVSLMRICTFSASPLCLIPAVIAVFSGLRLANFNVDERQHNSFLGLATPACALICGSLCCLVIYGNLEFLSVWASGFVFIPVLSVVLSALLVCRVPMFSLKFAKEDDPVLVRKRVYFLVNIAIICVIVAVFGFHWSMAVLLALLMYVLMNLVFAAFRI